MMDGVIDLPTLLAPLTDGGGAGIDPRAGDATLHRALLDARTAAREQERGAEDGRPDADPAAALAAWREVKRLALQCLGERSKDFEVAAWLLEALVRLDGLAGLAAGASLFAGLLDHFWETGFPRAADTGAPDDEAAAERLRALDAIGARGDGLGWGAGTIVQPIHLMPLFRRPDGTAVRVHDWNAAVRTATRREAHQAKGFPEDSEDVASLRDHARSQADGLVVLLGRIRNAAAFWEAMVRKADRRGSGAWSGGIGVSDALNHADRVVTDALKDCPETMRRHLPTPEPRRSVELLTLHPALLKPIGVGGAGTDIRNDSNPASPYWALRDARAAARHQERVADDDPASADPEATLAAWQTVKRLAIDALSDRSKDFEIASWLMEALIRTDGLPGLAAGADVFVGLCDAYWQTGYPRPEPDAEEGREWVDRMLPLDAFAASDFYEGRSRAGTVERAIYLLPLFHRADGREVLLPEWERAVRAEWLRGSLAPEPRIVDHMPRDFQVLRSAAQTRRDHLRTLLADIHATMSAWWRLELAVDARCDAGGTHGVSEALRHLERVVSDALWPWAVGAMRRSTPPMFA
jgi:type VI secretion system protein ImpA